MGEIYMQVAKIISSDHVTIVFPADGVSYTVRKSEGADRYNAMIDAIKNEDWDKVHDLGNPRRGIERWVSTSGRIKIDVDDNDVVNVTFDGEVVHSTLANRMVGMYLEGIDPTPLARFMENLSQNPSKRSVDELFGFLEASDLPITEDGHFLAYKRVRDNYTDIHSGTFDNSIGRVCEMARNRVDDNKERTCSAGLHFCSKEYLPYFGAGPGNRVMIVKINPRDVVSIPVDYNNAKGRACRYEVVGEIENYDFGDKSLEGAYRGADDDGLYRPSYDDDFGIDLDDLDDLDDYDDFVRW